VTVRFDSRSSYEGLSGGKIKKDSPVSWLQILQSPKLDLTYVCPWGPVKPSYSSNVSIQWSLAVASTSSNVDSAAAPIVSQPSIFCELCMQLTMMGVWITSDQLVGLNPCHWNRCNPLKDQSGKSNRSAEHRMLPNDNKCTYQYLLKLHDEYNVHHRAVMEWYLEMGTSLSRA